MNPVNLKLLFCPRCDKPFGLAKPENKRQLNEHVARAHPDYEPFWKTDI